MHESLRQDGDLCVPLVVRVFMSFTGDEDLLEHGLPRLSLAAYFC